MEEDDDDDTSAMIKRNLQPMMLHTFRTGWNALHTHELQSSHTPVEVMNLKEEKKIY